MREFVGEIRHGLPVVLEGPFPRIVGERDERDFALFAAHDGIGISQDMTAIRLKLDSAGDPIGTRSQELVGLLEIQLDRESGRYSRTGRRRDQ